MPQQFLPILPIIAKYPFIRFTAPFLQREYRSIDSMLSSKKKIDIEAKELGKRIVEAVIDGQDVEIDYPKAGFMCSSCDAACYDCIAITSKNFHLCNACGKCFENCLHEVSKETYEKWYRLAKRNAVAYLSSRVIVSQLDPWVRRKYAVKEADRYSRIMEEEEDESVIGLLSADLGIKAEIGEDYRIHVASYLRCAARIKADNWRLINRRLESGWIVLDKREFLRLLKERLREKLEEPIAYAKGLEGYIARLSTKAQRERGDVKELGKVEVSCFPPCMKRILSDLQHGVNVPHTARFALTSFLLNIGMSVDEIISLFRTAPDFDEEKTRYQVEHIAGERGKGTEYSCPACDTMRTYHNCYGECEVSHPISYYERCMRRKMDENRRRKAKGKRERRKRGRDKADTGNT